MSHFSPFVFLLWSVLSACLGGFYFYHLWKYDHFRCINPFTSARPGAFQRVMTYSYLLVVPSLLTWTIGFAAIKYKEGFVLLPDSGKVYPKPFSMWSPEHQAMNTPLNAIWALTWALESLTHLEELCFWLYLVHAGPAPVPWFKSLYFRIWIVGSISSAIIIFVVMGATTSNTFMNEASFQLAGSLIGLLITIGILPILYTFPGFIQAVRNEGGDMRAVVRLAKFHDLNIIRTVFRFLFLLPIFILSIDGLSAHDHPLNESMSTTDAFLVISGIACMVQSACTLMIFFPRDVEMETQRWLQSIPEHRSRAYRLKSKPPMDDTGIAQEQSKYLLTDSPIARNGGQFPPFSNNFTPQYNPDEYQRNRDVPYIPTNAHPKVYPMDLNEQIQIDTPWPGALTEANMRAFAQTVAQVNPLALYFKSPLDFDDTPRRRHWEIA